MNKEEIIRCTRCGEKLNSERTRKNKEGQRCRWARMEEEGTRVYRGPHMKEDVPFVESGTKEYQQTTLGDF